jgi:hypothetical protein
MRHIIIVIDLWLRPDQEARYRETRDVPPDENTRTHVVHEIGQEVAGIGALDDVWSSSVRGRPEEA